MPGVEIRANALETLFAGNRLRTVPTWTAGLPVPFAKGLRQYVGRFVEVPSTIPLHFSLEILVVLALSIAAVWLTAVLRPLRAFSVLSGAAVVMSGLAVIAFTFWYVWLQAVAATLAVALGYGVTVMREYTGAERERRRLARFLSREVTTSSSIRTSRRWERPPGWSPCCSPISGDSPRSRRSFTHGRWSSC